MSLIVISPFSANREPLIRKGLGITIKMAMMSRRQPAIFSRTGLDCDGVVVVASLVKNG